MNKIFFRFILLFAFLAPFGCKSNSKDSEYPAKLKIGAEDTQAYLPLLKGKKVGLVVNQTSTIGETHLLDSLISLGVEVKAIFAPEHGFRGEADAGEHINNDIDAKTGLPIYSLYGKTKKPTESMLKGIDVLVFDIQDVGVRFYTFISTLHYFVETSADYQIPLIILDRPNPNGHYVGGPVREEGFSSFVGVDPIPVVYGLTIGELGYMINQEHWASNRLSDLTVIKCQNYDHKTFYELPIKPSPNLPNIQSIYLYPSICLFEPTQISVGRGTNKQFQVIGGPDIHLGEYSFIPKDMPGAHDPVNEGKTCYGLDLSKVNAKEMGFDLTYLFDFYGKYENKWSFFTSESFFNKLMGNDWVLAGLKNNTPLETLEARWNTDLELFKEKRKKYLLYTDFD